MRAAILIQSPKVETYINALTAIQLKYKNIEKFDFFYVFPNLKNITMEEIREKFFMYSKEDDIYKFAIDISRELKIINNDDLIGYREELKKHLKNYSIIDVSGVSKNISISVASTMITNSNVHVGMLNWIYTFKKEEKWVLDQENHIYQDLFDDENLLYLRKDYFLKKHIILAGCIILIPTFIILCIEIFFPIFYIPDTITNLFGLLIGFAGLQLSILSIKKENKLG